jgi:hypothetical protein
MTGLFESPVQSSIAVEHICDFEIEFEPLQTIASPAVGTRLNVVVARGVARGPRLNGEFLPGGGDWITLGTDGIARLDVRATLRADDGHLVYVTNTGRHVGTDTTSARFAGGELIAWDEAYTHSSPLFETDSETYGWLNGAVTTAINEVALDRVHYRIYRIT